MPETQGQKNQTTMRYRAPVKQDEHLDDLKRVTEGMIASNFIEACHRAERHNCEGER